VSALVALGTALARASPRSADGLAAIDTVKASVLAIELRGIVRGVALSWLMTILTLIPRSAVGAGTLAYL
jgi:hypothetical protein